MNFDQIFLLSLLAAILVFFVWGRLRYDVVAFCALLIATVEGAVPYDEAFSGFGHPATFTVAAVLVISRGLQNSGAVDVLAKHLIPPMKRTWMHIGCMSGVAGGLSAIMNNVGALALLMPAALQSAAKAGRAPSLILMPLSFGSILGGMVTLIGTPPNIIVAAFRGRAEGQPFGMFDFTPVGGIVALVGISFIALVGWRLIPTKRATSLAPNELFQIENYVAEVLVTEESKAIGHSLRDLDDQVGAHDAVILGLIRNDGRIDRAGRREVISEGDILIIEAGPEALDKVMAELVLTPPGDEGVQRRFFKRKETTLIECVVEQRSPIADRTAESLRLRQRYRVNLLAVARSGQPFRGRLKSFRFRPGDVLLLEGDADRLHEVVSLLGCLPLAERGLIVGQPKQASLSIGIFATMILLATFGVLSMPVALALAAAIMIVINIVPAREIYDHVDWPVVVLLAAMIPVGNAMETTGTTHLIAGELVSIAQGWGPVAMLVLVMVITMTLSDVINNAATAVVMAPLGMGIARQLGVSADPFLMAVAIGASCAFLTPIGHQNNTLILGPGGYHFGDYWRMGLPLEILIVLVSTPLLLIFWPL